jgi:DNA-binding NtrC family response regulator
MRTLRILVVDDEETVRDVVARRLRQDGHAVESAPDGAEAWAAFERSGFDAVITDLNMPRMGGVELVRRIKEAAPGTVTVVLTGYGTLDSAVEVLRQGCDDYLLKPIENLDIVAHAVERSLARRDALLMAASARRLGEAKDNILGLVVEEFEARLGGIRTLVEKLAGPPAEPAPAGTAELARAIEAQLAQLAAVLEDVKLAHRTIRERSADRQ